MIEIDLVSRCIIGAYQVRSFCRLAALALATASSAAPKVT